MAQFTVTIEDAEQLRGLAAACAEHNAALDPPGDDNPDYCADEQAYVQFVMSRACDSYAAHYPADPPA